jgi:AGCS family alanine or glycine:cation symporter
LGKAIKLSFSRKSEGEGDVTHFGALVVALAATIGTGNIVGVATAVSIGGPGAVLWMWLTGVFGIATKYAEAVISVKYRVVNDRGEMAGGPMYVLERGLNARWLGLIFAALTAVAAFGIGNMVQANSVAQNIDKVFIDYMGMDPAHGATVRIVMGLIMATITAITLIGGVKSIADVCTALVPFMAVFYIIGCTLLLVVHFDRIPSTIALILTSAFTGHAALGGFVGATAKMAIQMGVARGLFSNESGLGSAPIVAAAAQTKNPVRQALVSSTGTFWDTVVICLLTGLVVVNSGMWAKEHEAAQLTQMAFSDLGWIGPVILTVGLITFVFSTILGWSYYGEKAVEYLFGTRAILPYRLLWVIAVFVGSVLKLKTVWAFADIANGLMAVPNLIALLLLSGVIVEETRKYLWAPDADLDNE